MSTSDNRLNAYKTVFYVLCKEKYEPVEAIAVIHRWLPEFSLEKTQTCEWSNSIKTRDDCLEKQPNKDRLLDEKKAQKIIAVARRNPFASFTQISILSGFSRPTVKKYLVLSGHLRRYRPRIPHEITSAHKYARVVYSAVLLAILEEARKVDFAFISSGDESYFRFEFDSPTQICEPGQSPTPRVKSTLGVKKQMLTICFHGMGSLVLHATKRNKTMDSDDHAEVVKAALRNWKIKTDALSEEEKARLASAKDAALQGVP